jgi:ubiquinone/menaquinone biosynthesis C-methylase UbiE
MSVVNPRIDRSAAEEYEKHLVPRIYAPWAEFVVRRANPQPGEHVLDVACGTGIGARLAARRTGPAGRVVGLDADPGMIEVAHSLASDASAAVELYCASAVAMPFDDASFDLCLCLQGLQFFPDPVSGFAEIQRVLKPGGRLVASVWAPLEQNAGYFALVTALERRRVFTTALRRPFSLGNPDELRDLAKQGGFRSIELSTELQPVHFRNSDAFIDSVAASGPSGRLALAQIPAELHGEFTGDVRGALAPYVEGAELLLPMQSHILVARP